MLHLPEHADVSKSHGKRGGSAAYLKESPDHARHLSLLESSVGDALMCTCPENQFLHTPLC